MDVYPSITFSIDKRNDNESDFDRILNFSSLFIIYISFPSIR